MDPGFRPAGGGPAPCESSAAGRLWPAPAVAVGELAACGMGFLASRKGVAERRLVELALELCRQFDHRGAPGHGAGVQLDIPWPLLLGRFPEHVRAIAQRDVALGMFFLPFEAEARRRCVELTEELAALGGADVLGWADVPCDLAALPADSEARRTAPVVRQAIFRRPAALSEEGWFTARFLLRLALDEVVAEEVGFDFSVVSLSNRTVVYKGLAELSRIAELYPDLGDPDCASRYVLFHSRYSTNTTTAWRRAQPFWALAHNGEITTVRGNVAWMHAIGRDLVRRLAERHPSLAPLAARVRSVVCAGGSDSANLDDLVIALVAGGMTLPQALLALLPESSRSAREAPKLAAFHDATAVFLGACDGPAAIVACDGAEAVAHLDRNGLRPLWIETTPLYVLAASELTGTADLGSIETRRVFGPGDTALVRLTDGEVLGAEEIHRDLARKRFRWPLRHVRLTGRAAPPPPPDLARLQRAFGMTREDLDTILEPLAATGKPAVGAMGDDTPPAALLDRWPRRLEDYFQLRFAQETSPPIDPIRDAWVFETSAVVGDRSGLWAEEAGTHFVLPERLPGAELVAALRSRRESLLLDLTFAAAEGAAGLERGLDAIVARGVEAAGRKAVLLLSDRRVSAARAPLPMLRAVARLHDALVARGSRHRVGLVADAGIWDVHHAALLIALGADAVHPWLGVASAGERSARYLEGLRAGFAEAMSMLGITPSAAYCGARLVEAIGLDRELVEREFPGVAGHLGGIGTEILDAEWLAFHAAAFDAAAAAELPDVGEYRFRKEGRPHFHAPAEVRALQRAAGFGRSRDAGRSGDAEAYGELRRAVRCRPPATLLDLLEPRPAQRALPLEQIEPVEAIAWRFFAPGMSEGALSEPAHRAVARGLNLLQRWCRRRCHRAGTPPPPGLGPFANSGEGGFAKARIGRADGNRSVQYAGGRFTVTPETAARAEEAEVKFAQGAKPGKGGQLPGRKVSARIASQRGCLPGFELVSPPVNHNLYSIEDVKLMLESWRHLNPEVRCALKYVATHGIALVCLGGVNAGAERLHLSGGCGGTGAAKRVDQKHAGVPVEVVLPKVHDLLAEAAVRERVELSVDGGLETGEQVVALALLGADRFGFGTSLLIALGCSMMRQCHLAGPQPGDPSGRRRLGCTPGVATQDPRLVANFRGRARSIANYLLLVAAEAREHLARLGARSLGEVVGRRDLLARRAGLAGKAARIDLSPLLGAPPLRVPARRPEAQRERFAVAPRWAEIDAARRALAGETVTVEGALTNRDRCVGVGAAGLVARARGDAGLGGGRVRFRHRGAAGHFYAAYALDGLDFRLDGVAADSCFTAAHGGRLVIRPEHGDGSLAVVGNTFAYGARAGRAYLAGRAGNRFAICLRRGPGGAGPRLVVEGVEANAFQYMTGGLALVLGPIGFNLGAGMTGGAVYLLEAPESRLDRRYVQRLPLDLEDGGIVRALLAEHVEATASPAAARLLAAFEPARFWKVVTRLEPEPVEE